MELSNVNKLYKISLFVLFLCVIECVTSVHKRWKRQVDFDGKFLPSGSAILVRSRIHCSTTCLGNSTCQSFFIHADNNCHLRNDVLSSVVGLQDLDKTFYYVIYNGATDLTTSSSVTTAPPVTAPPTTAPPVTTEPVTTAPITTAPPTTAPPFTTEPVTTAPVTTAPPTTAPPVTTEPVTTAPVTTAPSDTAPSATPFPCPPDDSIFRTVILSDGEQFTYKIVKTLASQFGARAACTAEGAILARVRTVAEMNMLRNLIYNCTGYFGSTDYYVDGSNGYYSLEDDEPWRFFDGTYVPMSNDFWGLTYPNNPGDENCLRMRAEADFMWDDCYCSRMCYYICEKE